jgi:acyl-CoA reductase-like NAD-dependent aldehyde dehydrogenase
LEDARAKGAHVIGGDMIDEDNLMIQPALIIDANHKMKCMNEETFGPIMPIMKVERGEEAIRLSNEGPFGLAGSIWSKDVARAERLGHSMEVGLLGVNDVMGHYAVCSLPFGGIKQSGLGRRHSDEGLRGFCSTQSVYVHEWPANQPELWWYPYDQAKTKLIAWLAKFS